MHTQFRHLAAVALITLLCSGGPAFAQSADVAKAYPTRTVRFVNPSTAGGGADTCAGRFGAAAAAEDSRGADAR
jgi:tripartite-type tricarboxylate transporter receptor subunit TctC